MNKSITKHANKAVHGLSAAALVFLYTHFSTKDDVRREIDQEHQRCVENNARQWRDMMDMLQAVTSTATTNKSQYASVP